MTGTVGMASNVGIAGNATAGRSHGITGTFVSSIRALQIDGALTADGVYGK